MFDFGVSSIQLPCYGLQPRSLSLLEVIKNSELRMKYLVVHDLLLLDLYEAAWNEGNPVQGRGYHD